MKKRILMIIMAVFLLGLSACAEGPLVITPTPTQEATPVPTLTNTPTPTPTNTPSPTEAPAARVEEVDATSGSISWTGSEGRFLVSFYKADGGERLYYVTEEQQTLISGLLPDTEYRVRIDLIEPGDEDASYGALVPLIEEFGFVTEKHGKGDPFLNALTMLKVAGEEKIVPFTSASGALGAKVWAQHACKLYTYPELTGSMVDIKGGTAFTVTEGEEGYCYLREDGRWSLHITSVADPGLSGYMDADLLFVDLCDLFTPENRTYALRIDRTNAYSSIFTTGGSVTAVDTDSDPETRYAVLDSEDTAFASLGYNVIDGITGTVLPGYGGTDQMPVVWDLAEELIKCQRNAFEAGTCLLIYEGYRPNSTSLKVSAAVSGGNYLTEVYNELTLANGFLEANYTYANYIADYSNHNKGIAVDLTIMGFESVDGLGAELVMQTKMHTLDFRGNMKYNNDNANLLYSIMTKGTDLQPLRSGAEWWHFQLIQDETIFPQIKTYLFVDYEI